MLCDYIHTVDKCVYVLARVNRDTRWQRRIFNCYEVFLDFENIIVVYSYKEREMEVSIDIFLAFPGC